MQTFRAALIRLASDRNKAATPPARLVRQMPAAWCEPDQESRMVLKIERFQPEGMNVRMSGGKPAYSHVGTVSGSGVTPTVVLVGVTTRDSACAAPASSSTGPSCSRSGVAGPRRVAV